MDIGGKMGAFWVGGVGGGAGLSGGAHFMPNFLGHSGRT